MALNIAEGSTGQSNPELARFLGYAVRSLVETIVCYRLAQRRGYIAESPMRADMEMRMEILARKLQSFRKVIRGNSNTARKWKGNGPLTMVK